MGAGANSLDSHPKVFNLAFIIIESTGLGLKLIDEEPLRHIRRLPPGDCQCPVLVRCCGGVQFSFLVAIADVLTGASGDVIS